MLKSYIIQLIARLRFGAGAVILANGAGSHPNGVVSRLAEAAITDQYLLVKKGTAADEMDVCGATDFPLGVSEDASVTINERGAVSLLGAASGTRMGVAAKAIGVDDLLYTAAAGQITDTSATGAYRVGRALTAAAAQGDEFEYEPILKTDAEA